jgi:predicted transcriptional regulator
MEPAHEIKRTAHQLIDSLPDDTTWEALLYTLQVRHDIEAGLADVEAGRVYSTEEVRMSLGIDNA